MTLFGTYKLLDMEKKLHYGSCNHSGANSMTASSYTKYPVPWKRSYIEWKTLLRADMDELGIPQERLDVVPDWMLERIYDAHIGSTIEQVLAFCETEAGKDYIDYLAKKPPQSENGSGLKAG